MGNKLDSIISKLKNTGDMSFFDGVSEDDIINFEKNNNVKLSSELRQWYLYSDGGEFFLPAGLQLYGVLHKPVIDLNDSDKPNDDYYVIGRLSWGDSVLCKKDSDEIFVYNHENGTISDDEVFSSFFEFIDNLGAFLGITK